jgi:hypothetical protein
VIIADPRGRPAATRIGGRATIDELLSRAAARRPDAVALPDPPNRESISDASGAVANVVGIARRDLRQVEAT